MASICPFSAVLFRSGNPLYSGNAQSTDLPANHYFGWRWRVLFQPGLLSHPPGPVPSDRSDPRVFRSCCAPDFGGQSPRSLQPQSWKHQVPIWKCSSGDLEFVVCVCVCIKLMWGLGFSFIFFLVHLKRKWAPPMRRQCVFIDFSKTLPVGKLIISDDSGVSRTQTHISILLAHPASCDYPQRVHLPQYPWTHRSSQPPTFYKCRPRIQFCVAKLN